MCETAVARATGTVASGGGQFDNCTTFATNSVCLSTVFGGVVAHAEDKGGDAATHL